jgi:cysteine sulfinate desulfinase/cysteine desulfurase-like protein
MLRISLNEFWTEADVRDAAKAINKVAAHYASKK